MASEERERIILGHKTNDVQDFTIELFLDYELEDGEWVGVCDQLGIATNGETLDETKEILRDLVLLQLSGVEELTSIYSYLEENEVVIMKPESPTTVESGFVLTTAAAGF